MRDRRSSPPARRLVSHHSFFLFHSFRDKRISAFRSYIIIPRSIIISFFLSLSFVLSFSRSRARARPAIASVHPRPTRASSPSDARSSSRAHEVAVRAPVAVRARSLVMNRKNILTRIPRARSLKRATRLRDAREPSTNAREGTHAIDRRSRDARPFGRGVTRVTPTTRATLISRSRMRTRMNENRRHRRQARMRVKKRECASTFDHSRSRRIRA